MHVGTLHNVTSHSSRLCAGDIEQPPMFSNLIDALQGPAVGAVDSPREGSPTEAEAGEDVTQNQPSFSIWGMASKLADTVKKGTAEIAARCAPL
jgi:hypothetical protein